MAIVEIKWHPSRRELRQFGLIGLVAFGALGAWVFWRHSFACFQFAPGASLALAALLWSLAGLCAALALLAPRGLRPLFIGLSLVTFPIGYVVSHVLLAVLFYGVVTPVGLVCRLLGHDPLNRRFDPDADTYWTPREPAQERQRYFHQF